MSSGPLAVQLLALGATLAIELPIAALLAPRSERTTILATAFCANLASHSLASMLWATAAAPWIALELGVVTFEAAALHFVAGQSWRRATALALAMNVPSALLGLAFA